MDSRATGKSVGSGSWNSIWLIWAHFCFFVARDLMNTSSHHTLLSVGRASNRLTMNLISKHVASRCPPAESKPEAEWSFAPRCKRITRILLEDIYSKSSRFRSRQTAFDDWKLIEAPKHTARKEKSSIEMKAHGLQPDERRTQLSETIYIKG